MEKENIKLSLIVPVYKVEQYLSKCLDSLINQTLNGLEIICVNDGSPDNCLQILREYEKKYSNIVVIDKPKNEGVWKARFDGIKVAKGEYIGFIDADDYIELDYAEKMYKTAKENEFDILVCGFDRVDMETLNVYSREMLKKAGQKIIMENSPEEVISINTALWNKIYRAEILKDMKNLSNPPRVLEDMMFLCLIYLKTKTIGFMPEVLYHYMVRKGSAMNTIKEQEIENIQNAMIEVRRVYEKERPQLLPVIDSMAFLHFGISLMFRISADKTINFKEALQKNRKYLDENFPNWKNCKYLELIYSFKHGANQKVAIMRKIYKFGLFRPFLCVYNFMINKIKIDIKW